MNKLKKIILILISTILLLFGINNVSHAFKYNYQIGGTYDIDASVDYGRWQGSFYCAQKGEIFDGGNIYKGKCVEIITIAGNTATNSRGESKTHWRNGQLAYLFNQSNLPPSDAELPTAKWLGPVQCSVHNMLDYWVSSVGQSLGVPGAFANSLRDTTYPMLSESEEYGKSLRDAKITNNTENSEIKQTTSIIDEKEYVRVGPFNLTIPKKLDNITVYGDGGAVVSGVKYSIYEGSTEKVVKAGGVKSNKDFYLNIPISDGMTSTITGLSASTSMSVMGVSIAFLQTENGYQNQMDTDPNSSSEEISIDIPLNIPLKPIIVITKKDLKDETLLENAVFGIYTDQNCTNKIAEGKSNDKGIFEISEYTSGGSIKIFDIGGTYWIKEEKPPQDYATAKPGTQKVGPLKPGKNKVNNVTFKNEKMTLTVIKVDQYRNYHRVQGAHFKIYTDPGLTKLVAEGTTDALGEISIKGVLFEYQTYYVKETTAPFGYELNPDIGQITLKAGSNIIKMTNPKLPDYIYKYADETQVQYPVANVTIGYKNWTPDNSKYTSPPPASAKPKDKSSYRWEEEYQRAEDAYNDWQDAYEHYKKSREGYIVTGVTDENGRVKIDGNVLREDGSYEIWEVESENRYFQIEKEVQKIKAHKPYVKEKEEIKNPRTHEDIEGWVWVEDVPKGQPNNLLEGDAGERLVDGALVQVKDKITGQVVATDEFGNTREMVTGSLSRKGYYKFNLLEVSKIKADEYIIEITYNGLLYESIPVKDLTTKMPNVSTSSKLSDNVSSRNMLNEKYSTIDKNSKTKPGGDAVQYNTNEPYESRRICDKQYQGQTDEGTACMQTTTTGYNVIADTTTSGYRLIDSYDAGYDCITNVNLGLSKREEPNLVLEKDLQTVKITINGEEHIYQYGEKNKALLKELLADKSIVPEAGKEDLASLYDLEPKLRFGEKYGGVSYTRALEASDIKYDNSKYGDVPTNKELEVTAIYRIGICNMSEGFTMKVNGLIDYLDDKYNLDTVQVSRGASLDGTLDQSKMLSVSKQNGSGGYNIIRINNLNLEIQPKTGGNIDQSIYVSAKVKKEKMATLVDNNVGIVKMDNFAEITSYTTIDRKAGKQVAGIDVNSQPENIEIGNTKTYEDDSNKAPDFKLVLQEPRKISGTVFIDKSQVDSNKIRQGDGIYTSDEPGLADVKVKVLINRYKNTTGNTKSENGWEDAKMYTNAGWKAAEGKTDEKGNFEIEGLIPGDYKIVYMWGGQYYELDGNRERVTVQDYKSTIVDKDVYAKKGLKENARIWYRDEFKKANREWNQTSNTEIRKSDAIDNYETREAIDKQDGIMTYHNQKLIQECNTNEQLEVENGVNSTLITEMDSTTPRFNLGVEYYESDKGDGKTPKEDEEYSKNGGNLVFKNGIVQKGNEEYKNHSKGFDFGIVRRARQKLGLHKELKRAQSIASNGTILAEAYRNQTLGEVSTNNNFVYLPRENGVEGSGVLKYEVDNEIEQSDKLAVEYEITISNIGEVEYLTKDFYNYGAGYGEERDKIVKLKARSIIDYLDNKITTSLDLDQEQWHIYAKKDYEKEFSNNSDPARHLLSEEVIKYLKDNQDNILAKENLEDVWLDPIEKKTVAIKLECSRLLANTNEDISFVNEAEIIRALKTGGATLDTTPGNYVPGKSETGEVDNDTSELITVISPTGLNKNYVAIGILALSSLGILLCGIILIKKYVLK